MPRGIPNHKTAPSTNGDADPGLKPLEVTLDEIRTLLESRRQEYQVSADRIGDILTTLSPKPRIGRPPKTAAPGR